MSSIILKDDHSEIIHYDFSDYPFTYENQPFQLIITLRLHLIGMMILNLLWLSMGR